MANFHLTYRNSNRSGQIDHAATQSAHIKLNPLLMSRSRISCLLFFLLCWWLIVLSLMYEYVQFTLTYISIASFVQAEVL